MLIQMKDNCLKILKIPFCFTRFAIIRIMIDAVNKSESVKAALTFKQQTHVAIDLYKTGGLENMGFQLCMVQSPRLGSSMQGAGRSGGSSRTKPVHGR